MTGDDDDSLLHAAIFLQAAIYLVMLGKARDSIASLLFFLLATNIFSCETGYENWVLHVPQLVSQRRSKLQVKLPRVTVPLLLSHASSLACLHPWSRH